MRGLPTDLPTDVPADLPVGPRAAEPPDGAAELRRFRRSRISLAAMYALPLALAPFMEADRRRATLFGVEGPRCPVGDSAGWPCPGCGLTRGFVTAVHGDWAESFSVHPAAALIVFLAAAGAAAHTFVAYRGEIARPLRIGFRIGRIAFFAALVFTMAWRATH